MYVAGEPPVEAWKTTVEKPKKRMKLKKKN